MLNSIKLTNFKKHRNLEVNFTEGLNVVKGANFCGKSTLLKAVAVALYGITGAGTKAKICTAGESKWKVELSIEIGGKDYTIIRSGSSAKVLHNDVLVANGTSAVTAWVSDNSGSDLEDFLTHTYSKQMETSTLLTMGSGKLQNKVEKLAHVEVVDKVLKKLREKTSETNGKLDLLSEIDLEQIIKDNDEAVLESNSADEKHKFQQHRLDCANKKLLELNEKVAEINLNIDNITNTEARLQVCKDLDESYKTNLKNLKVKIAELPKVNEQSVNKLSEKIKQFSDTLLYKTEEVSVKERLETESEAARDWIAKVGHKNLKEEKRIDALLELEEKNLAVMSEELDQKRLQIDKLKEKVSVKQSALDDAVCPTCLRDNEGADKEAIESELTVLNNQVQKEKERMAEFLEKVTAGRELVEQLTEEHPGEGHEELIKQQSSVIANAEEKLLGMQDCPTKAELEEMRGELGPMVTEEASLRNVLEKENSYNSLVADDERFMAENNQELIDHCALLKTLKVKPHDNSELTQKIENLKQNLSIYKDEEVLSGSNKRQADITKAVTESKLGEAQKTDKLFKELKKSIGIFSKLAKYLRESRARFLSSVWDGILSRATEIVSGATAGNVDQITQISRDKKGSFMYMEKGEEFGINDASGCQMEMMGVAMRLSLCDLFYGNGSYMMLDEASSQMNEENAAALAGVLAATGKQIVYVTHRETEETSANNVITVG